MFIGAVDTMVRLVEDSLLTFEDNKRYMSKSQWTRDMATVNLSVPRQVGKTSYIIKRASCADLVIVHNQAMKDLYRGACALVVTPPELNRLNRGRVQRGFHRVYVDEPRLVFTSGFSLDELYSLFDGSQCSPYCANMFIMLGT